MLTWSSGKSIFDTFQANQCRSTFRLIGRQDWLNRTQSQFHSSMQSRAVNTLLAESSEFEWHRRSTINPDSQLHVLELAFREEGIKVQIDVWPVCTRYAEKMSQIRNKHDSVHGCVRRESSNRHGFLKHFGLKNGEIADQKSSNLLQATVSVVRPSKPISFFYIFCSLKYDIISAYFSHRQRSLATRSEGLYIPCWAYGWRSVLTSVTSVNVAKACPEMTL